MASTRSHGRATLAVVCASALDHQRGQHDPQRGSADSRPGAARHLVRPAMDRRFLCHGLRRPPARRGQPGGPLRSQVVLPRRPHRLRRRVHRSCLLELGSALDRMQGRDGRRGGTDDPCLVVDHQRRLPRPGGSRPGHRGLGWSHRTRHRDRPDRGRPAPRPVLVGVDIPRQRPHRRRRIRERSRPRAEFEEQGGETARSRRGALLDRRPRPALVGPHRGTGAGLDIPGGDRRRSDELRGRRRLHRLGGPQPSPDAGSRALFRPEVLRRRRGGVPGDLRSFGGTVPPDPGAAVRPRLLAPPSRAENPPDCHPPRRERAFVPGSRPPRRSQTDRRQPRSRPSPPAFVGTRPPPRRARPT